MEKKKWKQTQPNTLTSDASITNLNEALTTELSRDDKRGCVTLFR